MQVGPFFFLLRFRRDFIAGDGSRLIDIVDQQYESGKEPPMRRFPVPRVSHYNSSEGFLYCGKKYADIAALKENLESQIFGFKSFLLEFREPLSDGNSADGGRCRHSLYMIDRGRVNCVSCEDDGEGFTVTMDVDRVNAFVWKEMVRTRFARDEDIFVVSSNYSALSLARGMARS